MDPASLKNLPCCKYLWSVISGTTCRYENELVRDEIKNATNLLKEGLNFFKKYTEASMKSISKSNIHPKVLDLIGKLAPLLNLDAQITQDLVCNYTCYEYRNCGETLQCQLNDITTMKVVIEDIWSFYYSERITLIKCLKLMAEYKDNAKHPHFKEFSKFFDDILFGELLDSLQKQIEALKFINPPKSELCNEDHHHRLYNSSLIEMRELLHIFTIIVHDVHVAENKFNGIYSSIVGEPRRLTSTKSYEDKEAVAKKIEDIHYSQAALLLVTLDVRKHSAMEDWVKSVRETMQDILEHKCVRDSSIQDAPLLLAWMLANYAIEPENTDTLNRFRPFGIRAIQLNVFLYLKGLMESEMVTEDTHYASVVRSSVYNLFTLLCAFVDEDRVSSFNGIFEALAATLKHSDNAARFWQEGNDGLWILYKCAAELFPYKFDPLTVVATGLAAASATSAKKTAQSLDNLESITIEVPRHRENLAKPLNPYQKECKIYKNDFTLPPRCNRETLETLSNDIDVIMWHIKANYWDAFHCKIEQLCSQAGGGMANVSENQTCLAENVAKGFRLLEVLLETDFEIPTSMVIPTELTFEIIHKFSYPSLPLNIYKIVASCIGISSKLVSRYPEEILSRMRTGVYPRFDNWYQGTIEFAQAMSFDGGLIASWLSGIETIEHKYPILNAYLCILLNYLKARYSKEAMYSVEIPGMVFLLQGVLPKLDTWYFESEIERIDLWLKSMFCLHRSLETNLPKKDPRSELQNIVAFSLLYLEPRHALLKLVRTGERTLQNKMLNETDWISGKGYKILTSVQLALSLVNRLLMFRKNLGLELEERSPLEVALYSSPCSPNGLLIVPTIVNYLYVWFSTSLQEMAVRLLKKFAEGFSMSLLVCMGMDGTAIRETFASRLTLPTCSVNVKVAILELVSVCLEKQPGLTEALFNIMHPVEQKRIFRRPIGEFQTKGCSDFLDLYLQKIYDTSDIVYDKLYDSTMNLLRAMWYNRNEILVNHFRKRPNFWTHLFSPLFRDLVTNVKGYYQLIDIITLELFKSTTVNTDFSVNLKKLLDKNEHYWERMARYLFEAIPTDYEDDDMDVEEYEFMKSQKLQYQHCPLYELNLESWYHFVVILTDERISENYAIDVHQIQTMTRLTLDTLLTLLKRPFGVKVSRIITLLTSLSLRCVTSWKLMCIGNSQEFRNRLTELTQEITHSYRAYGKSLRQTLISLLLGCTQLVKSTLAEDTSNLEYLLNHSCILAMSELEHLKQAVIHYLNDEKSKVAKDPVEENPSIFGAVRGCLPATLTVSLVTQLLRSHVENISNSSRNRKKSTCIQLRQMVPELMACLGLTLQKYPYVRFSKACLSFLSMISRSPYINPPPFNEDAITKLWLSLTPPAEIGNSMLDSLYDDCTGNGWRCQDWWPLYTLGLEFLSGLVTTDASYMYVEQIVMFLGSHEYQLMEASTILRHTADLLAADLMQSLVALISALAVKPFIWNVTQPSVRETLIKCMYLAYDSTVNLLLRPRILKFIIDGISVKSAEELHFCDERLPSGELKLLVNKLIIINTTCALSFVQFAPKLNALVDTIYTEDFWYTPMAEMNFGPPQMSMSSGPRLTYGTIISSTQLFTQALYSRAQSSKTSQSPQNSKDDKIDSAQKEWERATPEHLRRIHATGTKQNIDVTLLSSPRLVRRPYDPLICENSILSRATALVPGRHAPKSGSNTGAGNTSVSENTNVYRSPNGKFSDPWFDSMDENNTRLALEINLILILCQALEGIKSPRLALRDRQLITRETATELGVFFDFLEHRATPDNWHIRGSLVDVDSQRSRIINAPDDEIHPPARLRHDSMEDETAASGTEAGPSTAEKRLVEDIRTTGTFDLNINVMDFLPLLGKLLKTVVESSDSTQFG